MPMGSERAGSQVRDCVAHGHITIKRARPGVEEDKKEGRGKRGARTLLCGKAFAGTGCWKKKAGLKSKAIQEIGLCVDLLREGGAKGAECKRAKEYTRSGGKTQAEGSRALGIAPRSDSKRGEEWGRWASETLETQAGR